MTAWQFARHFLATTGPVHHAILAVVLTLVTLAALLSGELNGLHGARAVFPGIGEFTACALLLWGLLGIGRVQRWIDPMLRR